MADRITSRDLEQLCRIVESRLTYPAGGPIWSRNDAGENVARIGAYYIDGAYGGVALYRIVTAGGGVTDVFSAGHMPKRELYNRMRAYIQGLEDGAT